MLYAEEAGRCCGPSSTSRKPPSLVGSLGHPSHDSFVPFKSVECALAIQNQPAPYETQSLVKLFQVHFEHISVLAPRLET